MESVERGLVAEKNLFMEEARSNLHRPMSYTQHTR